MLKMEFDMGLSVTHLLIFLLIVVVIFGAKKLRNIGSDLGGAVKGFKDGLKDGGPVGAGKIADSAADQSKSVDPVAAKSAQSKAE